MIGFVKTIAGGAVALVLAAGIASAQTRVDAKKDWSVFIAGEGAKQVCWVVTQPTAKSAKRGGKEVQVQRGDIFLMVTARKADKVKNEVSFLSGYPFKGGSKVEVRVGAKRFSLFTDGENAWTTSNSQDNQVTAAFRAGAKATVIGTSQRGTTTTDTFSLSGFTAALKEAQARCQ